MIYKPEPIGTITNFIISFDLLTFTTSRFLIAFPPPWCAGYWHSRRYYQYFPSEWRCLGKIIISLTFDSGTCSGIRISLYSVILSLDKWQVFKCEVIESLQSSKRKKARTDLLNFHSFPCTWTSAKKAHHRHVYKPNINNILTASYVQTLIGSITNNLNAISCSLSRFSFHLRFSF